MNHPPITCICGCGNTGENWRRRLLKACYQRHLRAGTLHQFPRANRSRWYAPRAGRIEDYFDLLRFGVPRQHIPDRLGITNRTLHRYERDLRVLAHYVIHLAATSQHAEQAAA
ncbi:hypothetical protein ACLQ2R_17520 [Streptosporangium sp. DT93]|uniref:hypothetical protein n=1 Tax=Streptosporangium sp. DT93 TaxID=3393428 RepID=UPI003CEDF72A